MRIFILLLSTLSGVAITHAQTPATSAAQGDAPDVQVVKYSWSKQRINWEQNPFGGPNENFHEMQFRTRAEKRATDAKRSGNSAETSKLEREAQVAAVIVEAERQKKGPPRYAFLYKTSFKNNSGKTIRGMDWDYVFFDAATNQMIGRIEFGSDEKIEPGKRKEFSFFIPTPPAKTISVHALNSKEERGFTEQIVLVRVVYADGTVWQRPEPASPQP